MPFRIFRILALGCAILCWPLHGYARTPSKCKLSGKITNAPHAGFSVKLKTFEKNPLAIYDGYSVQVAPDGRFDFEDVDPGTYLLVAEGPGFMPTEYGADGPEHSATPIELKPGQHRQGMAITLTPKHVVCGKITDDQARPLQNVWVIALSHHSGSMWLEGGKPEDTQTITDDEGYYRLPNLDPGEYFIQAGMYTWLSKSTHLTQSEAERQVNAERVEVGPDRGAGCREDIRIGPRVGYRGFSVRGKIAQAPAFAGKDQVLSLLEEVNGAGPTQVLPTGESFNPGPSFDLWGVPAGRYRLILSQGRFPQRGPAGQPAFTVLSSQEITVADTDINGVTVAPDPLASLAGQVKLEDFAAEVACPTREKAHLRIQKEDDGQFQNIELAADGKFSFAHVPLGTYTVHLFPFLRGAVYVKSMLFDGEAVDGRRIKVSSVASHSLEVVLSGDAAHASGHVAPDESLARYQAQGTHPQASLSGKVRNALPNAPWVKLWAVRFNSDRSYGYSTRPGPDGSFHFENVDPGIYLLLTQGPGYTLSEYGASYPGLEGTAITLNAGQHLDGLTLIAAPRMPSICGRVIDEDGRPLPNVPVFATPSPNHGNGPVNAGSNSNGAQVAGSPMVFSLAPPSVNTDSAGNFQFFDLRPGQYFTWTDFMAPSGQVWTRHWTYYPSSPNFDGAQPIEIGFTPDTGCTHNIRMRSSPDFHIRGKLAGPVPDALGDHFWISLREMNSVGVSVFREYGRPIEANAAFDFEHVRPGHYRIVVTGHHGEPPTGGSAFTPCSFHNHLVSSLDVAVEAGDLNNLTMESIPPLSVTGEIHYENIPKEWRDFKVDAQNVSLSPVYEFPSARRTQFLGGACPQRARLTSDVNFIVENLTEGIYQVDVHLNGVQGDALYLKSIALNGRPIEGRHITLKSGQPARLTMVVSNNGGELDVQVERSGPPAEEYHDDQPCRPNMPVAPEVWLIPDVIPADGSGIVTSWPQGPRRVAISRVPPGRYHAVAGENFNNYFHFTWSPFKFSVWEDPKFLQSMSALGTPVEVAAGQRIKLSLLDATAQMQGLLARYNEEISVGDHCAASCTVEGFWNGAETAQAQKP